jgi:hypothetical protein
LKQTRDELADKVRLAASLDIPFDIEEQRVDLGLSLEAHKNQVEIGQLHQDLRETIEKHGLRVSFSRWIFGLVCSWLVCVAVCVFMSGFNAWGFKLPDTVLIAFITSTTLNVLGLFVVVAKWMYPAESFPRVTEKRAPQRTGNNQ